jgi:uncharacterized protein DUF5709
MATKMFEYDPGDGDVDYGNPLSPEESLDQDEFGEDEDIADGYSPAERPWGVSEWGVTSYEESRHESLGRRLAREQRELTDEPEGDGIGDSIGTDGELIDDQVGDRRAGRLVVGAIDELDARSDYWAADAGIDGAGASAEEAAIHVVPDNVDPAISGPDPIWVESAPAARATTAADET